MKEIIAQTAGRLVEEIFKTIEKVGLSNVGKTAEELLNVVKAGTLELVSAAISEMDAAVLSAKKGRKLDGLTVKERSKDHNALRNGLEIYNKYAEKQIAEAFGGYHDWSVFENEHAGLTCGKLTGTAVLLKACAKLRPLDSCA